MVRALDLLFEIAGSIPAAPHSSATSGKSFTHIFLRQHALERAGVGEGEG